jgi:hypothetical protein
LRGALLAVVDSNPQFGGFEDELNSGLREVLTKDGATVGVIYPDTLDEIQYAGKLFCLSIRGEPRSSELSWLSEVYGKDDEDEVEDPFEGKFVMGLVLEEDLEIEDGYRRIELARWVKKSLFEDSRSSSITLI